MALQLSQEDLIGLRSQWSEVMAMTKYLNQDVVGIMFVSLLAENPTLRNDFTFEVLKEQQLLFSELIKCAMMYLHDTTNLDECLHSFVKENPQIVEVGSKYLGPMCAAMMKTLKRTLKSAFNLRTERLWIEVYQYVKDAVLESPGEFFVSNSIAGNEEETQPLKIQRPSNDRRPEPFSKKDNDYISLILSENQRYRGFRRSVLESPQTPLLIKIPDNFKSIPDPNSNSVSETPLDKPVLEKLSNDYRTFSPLRNPPETPKLTPRSPRRDTSLQLRKLGLALSGTLYDPRGKASPRKNKSGSKASADFLSPEIMRNKIADRTDSFISNSSDDNLSETLIDFTQNVISRIPIFEPNSFGIKGLAPIEEYEQDDEHYDSNTSSIYESTIDKSSDGDATSRTSSLSLHHLGYKSSILSESGTSNYNKSPGVDSARLKYDFAFQADPPKPMFVIGDLAYLTSLPMINPRTSSGKSASTGFMKTSFVLKNDMIHEKGYNIDVSASLYADIPTSGIPKCRSLPSLPGRVPSTTISVTNLEPLAYFAQSSAGHGEKKLGFFRRLGMRLLSGSSRRMSFDIINSHEKARNKRIDVAEATQHDSSAIEDGESNQQSPYNVNNSHKSSHRVTSLDVRLKPSNSEQSGYASSTYLKAYSTKSSYSSRSLDTEQKRSFFSKSSKLLIERRENKYMVNKAPFKVI